MHARGRYNSTPILQRRITDEHIGLHRTPGHGCLPLHHLQANSKARGSFVSYLANRRYLQILMDIASGRHSQWERYPLPIKKPCRSRSCPDGYQMVGAANCIRPKCKGGISFTGITPLMLPNNTPMGSLSTTTQIGTCCLFQAFSDS